MILVGDLGGTKTVFALAERPGPHGVRLRHVQSFPSQSTSTFEPLLEHYLGTLGAPPIDVACLGVAGPVSEGRCSTTNLPWQLDEGAIARAVGARRARLANDLEATAYGVIELRPEQLHRLQGEPCAASPRGTLAVLAAGTGLGEATLVETAAGHLALASEAGHADFAPRNELEVELWRWLRSRLRGRVSLERVVSGPGLRDLHAFLREHRRAPAPAWLSERLQSEDPSSVIGQVGCEGGDPLCVEALDLFLGAYGAEAGNFALRALPTGGVFLGGGIAPKLLPAFQRPAFLDAFHDKGRFAERMREVPIHVVLEPHAALLGAAHLGLALVGSTSRP